MEDGPKIGAFLSVFQEKLSRLRKNIKKELEKDKNSRNKSFLKQQLKEAKNLKKVAKEIQNAAQELEELVQCPHCGSSFPCNGNRKENK